MLRLATRHATPARLSSFVQIFLHLIRYCALSATMWERVIPHSAWRLISRLRRSWGCWTIPARPDPAVLGVHQGSIGLVIDAVQQGPHRSPR